MHARAWMYACVRAHLCEGIAQAEVLGLEATFIQQLFTDPLPDIFLDTDGIGMKET